MFNVGFQWETGQYHISEHLNDFWCGCTRQQYCHTQKDISSWNLGARHFWLTLPHDLFLQTFWIGTGCSDLHHGAHTPPLHQRVILLTGEAELEQEQQLGHKDDVFWLGPQVFTLDISPERTQKSTELHEVSGKHIDQKYSCISPNLIGQWHAQ